jgi:hypothetical protein
MVCPIAWCSFTWEAFSTLTAGLAAVVGATVVGIRQIRVTSKQSDIASRQADILAHQVEVDRAKLRADLFDRRLAVYKACKAYIREAMNLRVEFFINWQIQDELARQLEQAEFLFAGSVTDLLRKAANDADQLLTEREKLRDLRKNPGVEEILGRTIDSDRQAHLVRDMNTKLRDSLSGLSNAMGDEMRLYIPRAKKR